MPNTLRHKRSTAAGVVPTTAALSLGELAINTYDGKLYLKKNVSGSETVVEVGAITSGGVTAALGYTPANKAGESFTGAISGNRLSQKRSTWAGVSSQSATSLIVRNAWGDFSIGSGRSAAGAAQVSPGCPGRPVPSSGRSLFA